MFSATVNNAHGIQTLRKYWFRLAMILAWACLSIPATQARADDDDEEEIPFGAVRIIFETNASDGDAGIQVFLDGEPWNEVEIENPCGEEIFKVKGRGALNGFGLTELFFESNEPPFDEVPLAEVLALFPEGKYEFEGETVDGKELEGEAVLTHVIPAGPEIVTPLSFSEDPPMVDPDNTVIEWDPVTTTLTGSGLEIAGYQVVVHAEESGLNFSVHLPATATIVTIPPEFLEDDAEYTFEVLAIEVSGNQTITEGEFVTAPEP